MAAKVADNGLRTYQHYDNTHKGFTYNDFTHNDFTYN